MWHPATDCGDRVDCLADADGIIFCRGDPSRGLEGLASEIRSGDGAGVRVAVGVGVGFNKCFDVCSNSNHCSHDHFN